MLRLSAVVLAAFFMAVPVHAEKLSGPRAGIVIRVIDGDTVEVMVRIWLRQYIAARVRLAGVNAPELHRPKCAEEKIKAEAAAGRLRALLPKGTVVTLKDIRDGKWAGRIVARLTVAGNVDVSEVLIEEGFGRPYDGGKRQGWCRSKGKGGEGT